MKKITATELKNILAQHALWLESGYHQGEQAILIGENLRGANLEGANLYLANLYLANLYIANLKGANLSGANLIGANLEGANLVGTILEKKETMLSSESNLRTKFDELAKSLGLKIVSLKVEREKTIVETINL